MVLSHTGTLCYHKIKEQLTAEYPFNSQANDISLSAKWMMRFLQFKANIKLPYYVISNNCVKILVIKFQLMCLSE